MLKLFIISFLIATQAAWAATNTTTLTGKVPSLYSGIGFFSVKGYFTSGRISGSSFKINVPTKDLKGGWVILLKTGNKFDSALVLAQKGNKSYLQFAASPVKSIPLGTIVRVSKGYAKLKKAPATTVYDTKAYASTNLLGAPLGLNIGSHAASSRRILANGTGTGDSDRDGVPNGIDVDAHGSGSVDGLTLGSSSSAQAPYLIVRENMSHTINATATGVPSSSMIDDILTSQSSSEFIMGFGFTARDDLSRITGAHIVCDDSNTLCGRDAGLATINNMVGGLWRDYHPDGTTYPGLDFQPSSPQEKFFNSGIKPHIGPSLLQPGDTYRVEFTGTDGAVIRSQLATISPYLVTVPALASYTANGSDHSVDYDAISTEPGAAMDNPIVLGSDGILRLTFWRPQRQGLGGADGTDYVDVGHLRYGIVLLGVVGGGGGGPGEAACGGTYSLPSDTLVDTGAHGQNDFWPLNDSAEDSAPSPASTLAFSIDLKTCVTQAGYSTGQTFMLSLQAAGPDLGHGSNRSGQDFTVSIP